MTRRLLKRIEREGAPWGQALSALGWAGLAVLDGDPNAGSQLQAAGQAFEAAEMSQMAVLAERARGALLGGEVGAALVDKADARLRTQGVLRPEALAHMMLGFYGAISPQA